MSNVFKAPQSGTNPLASDVGQIIQALSGQADVGQLTLTQAQATPSAPAGTATGTGNLNGTYYYKTVLITGWQQSDGSFYVNGFAPSADSAAVTVTNGQVNLTNIASGGAGTIGRAIYRTAAGGATGTEKFAFVIWDNTTTSYTDNIPDSQLGTGMPTSSSSPAVYGNAIPANVPTSNTTGTSIIVNGSWITSGTVPASALASGAAVANIGYTPVNKAGDTMPAPLVISQNANVPSLTLQGATTGWASGIKFINTTSSTGRAYGIYSDNQGNFIISDETASAYRITVGQNGVIRLNNYTAWHAGNSPSAHVITLLSSANPLQSTATSPGNLYNTNFTWSSSYAVGRSIYFEAVFGIASAGQGVWADVALYDSSSSTSIVTMGTNSATAFTRSAAISITDGHTIGVSLYISTSSSINANLWQARLIIM
jgi:hypothetical protein